MQKFIKKYFLIIIIIVLLSNLIIGLFQTYILIDIKNKAGVPYNLEKRLDDIYMELWELKSKF